MDLTGKHRQFPDIFLMQRFYCTNASNFYLLGNSLELQAHLFFLTYSLGRGHQRRGSMEEKRPKTMEPLGKGTHNGA